jgi:DNA-binding MarR family transcriptional regulator
MNASTRNLSEIDRVIHEPGRLVIVALLFAVEQADFLYLQYETGLNKGTLSSHLARLEKAGYVEITKTYRGKLPQTLLQLTTAGRRIFAQYKKQMQKGLQI